ncbi:18108_t:CDS:2, partial [Gigaspora rosea]
EVIDNKVVERLNNIELIINENKSDFILPLTPPSSPMDPRSITPNTHLIFPLSTIESNKHTPNQPSLIHVFEPPTLQEMNNKNSFH